METPRAPGEAPGEAIVAMLGNQALLETTIASAPTTSLKEVEGVLSKVARQSGFEFYSYVGGKVFSTVGRGLRKFVGEPLVITNFPVEWISMYHERNFGCVDPVVGRVLDTRLPFIWDLQEAKGEGKTQTEFLKTAQDFSVCRGYSVPILGPEGDYGLFTVVSVLGAREFDSLIREVQAPLFLLANHIHQAVRRFANGEPDPVHLTAREREVLQWTAAGKTNMEIGVILTISAKTVEYHLYNGMRKLDVYSKAQAVAKAMLLGLIFPGQ